MQFLPLFQLYSMDISPNYSGTIFGLAVGFAYLAGVVNSALLGNFISGNVSKIIQ